MLWQINKDIIMSIINIGSNKYVAGLHWNRLSGEKIKSEISSISNEMEMSFGLVRKIESEDDVIYQAGFYPDKEVKGMYSAAAILADIIENALVIEEIGEDEYWICAVADSEVLPGGDLISSREEISHNIEDIFNNLSEGLEGFTSYMSANISLMTGINHDYEYGLAGIINNADQDLLKKELPRCKILPIGSSKRPIILLGGFIVTACIAGYVFVGSNDSSYNSHVERDSEVLELVLAKRGPSKEDILQAAYDEEVQLLREKLSSQDPGMIIKSAIKYVRSMPYHAGGWIPISASYNRNIKGSLSISWARDYQGTPTTLRDAMQGKGSVSVDINAAGASSRHDVISEGRKDLPKDIDKAMSNVEYNHTMLSHQLIRKEFSWSFVRKPSRERASEIKGIDDKELSSQSQLIAPYIEFKVNGLGLNRLEELSRELDKVDYLIINNFNIDINADSSWRINGEIYEK